MDFEPIEAYDLAVDNVLDRFPEYKNSVVILKKQDLSVIKAAFDLSNQTAAKRPRADDEILLTSKRPKRNIQKKNIAVHCNLIMCLIHNVTIIICFINLCIFIAYMDYFILLHVYYVYALCIHSCLTL